MALRNHHGTTTGPEQAHADLDVVLLDQDNVRAAMGWPGSRAFRNRVCRWAMDRGEVVVVEVDERQRSERQRPHAHTLTHPRVCAVFTGALWRADDGIVRDVEWWLSRPQTKSALVISSDKLVRRRCAEVKQRVCAQQAKSLRFDTGESFAFLLRNASGLDDFAPATAAQATTGEQKQQQDSIDGGTACTSEFVNWIESAEQLRPRFTAAEHVHSGAIQRRGTKRKLGVKR